jgi:short-subunit dehydrogenase
LGDFHRETRANFRSVDEQLADIKGDRRHRQGFGHLVLISSIAALRGMGKNMTAYAALGAGLRSERIPGVDISVRYPGCIRTDINAHIDQNTRLMVDTPTGVQAMVTATEKRRAKAYVPPWPWTPVATALKLAPLSLLRRRT